MTRYAVKPDGSWRCVDMETMPLADDEAFQEEMPVTETQEVMP